MPVELVNLHNHFVLSANDLIGMVDDARERLVSLVEDLSEAQLNSPYVETVNILHWEMGHVGFFYDSFILRYLYGCQPQLEDADELFDSFGVPHKERWMLELPSYESILRYITAVKEAAIDRIAGTTPSPTETYLYLLAIYHEDMHSEAFTYTRQTLEYPPPIRRRDEVVSGGGLSGDVEVPGGAYPLGAAEHQPFVYDNEKWAHPVEMEPFRIARAPVTQGEFAEFVDAGGYDHPEYWSYGGRLWLRDANAKHPRYWRRDAGQWMQRCFNQYEAIREHHPVVFVNWWEAEAWCNWAGRRLPTEAEWERAASTESNGVCEAHTKRTYPWGEDAPSAATANLDSLRGACVDVGALPESDSPFGCRQMVGNVWEWTASDFYPFPGYLVDRPYSQYSCASFGYHKVLRGGSWATCSRLIRNTWRNFFLPHRNDILAGFRSCAR